MSERDEEIDRGYASLEDMLVNGKAGNTKGGNITVQLTSCLTGFESAL